MKADREKPLHLDYRKEQVLRFFWGTPIISGEKSYRLADIPLVAIGRILIVLAIGVIGYSVTFWRAYPFEYWWSYSFEAVVIYLIIIIIVTSLYKQIFVYRFGRFRATWRNKELHPETPASSLCDKDGKFLKTEENRKAARKSRRAFLVLFAGIIAVVFMYCFLWIGLSHLRIVCWHRGEIEEAWQIAQKYDHVSWAWGDINGETEGGEDLSRQDRQRLWEIFNSLKRDYVYDCDIRCKEGYIEIRIHTVFGHSNLVWYEDIRDTSQVRSIAETKIRLSEHWWYLRMDDGGEF